MVVAVALIGTCLCAVEGLDTCTWGCRAVFTAEDLKLVFSAAVCHCLALAACDAFEFREQEGTIIVS